MGVEPDDVSFPRILFTFVINYECVFYVSIIGEFINYYSLIYLIFLRRKLLIRSSNFLWKRVLRGVAQMQQGFDL